MSYKHKVQYYETDQMSIVHHSNYIRWFEEARTDLLEQIGFGYKKMESMGIISPVLTVSAEYKSMTHFYDEVEIEVLISAYNGIKIALKYVVRDANTQEIRCIGTSSHCFLNEEGRPMSLKKSFPEVDEAIKGIMQTDAPKLLP